MDKRLAGFGLSVCENDNRWDIPIFSEAYSSLSLLNPTIGLSVCENDNRCDIPIFSEAYSSLS
ncbi:hypothetical protein JT232_01870 [Helicobacter pylori]|nr:hypothetical protein [Helicobacter pylori]